MSSYDIVINLDERTLNRTVSSLFGRQSLKNRLFNGSKNISLGGAEVAVGWEIQQVPVVHLTPPSPQQWQNAIKGDRDMVQPTQNTFVLDFPSLKVTKKQSSGEIESETTSVSAIGTITVSQSQVNLKLVAVVIDLSQAPEFDRQFTYPLVIIPQVLGMANSMLSGVQLPNISFQGVQFGSEVITVENGTLALIANLNGKPTPSIPSPNSLPDGAFYILLSREAMQQIANQGVEGLRGKSDGKSGSESLGITTAKYKANIRLDNVSANVSNPNLTTVDTAIGTSISASAGVSTLLGEIGFSYNAKTEPTSISARLVLSFSNTKLRAIVRQVDPFIITLTPSGNVAQWILSGVAWPLAQTLSIILPQIAKDLINGYSFDVITISPSTQTVEGEVITVTPRNLSLSNYHNMLMVKGEVDIS